MTIYEGVSLPVYNQEQSADINLRRYWRVIVYRKWWVFLFVVLMTSIMAFMVKNMEPVFRASTTILIESQQAKVLSIENLYGLNTKDQEYFLTQFEILKSRELAEKVVIKLHLDDNINFDPRQKEMNILFHYLPDFVTSNSVELTDELVFEIVVNDFLDKLSVSPVRNTQLVKVNFELADPKLAARIADTIAYEYIDGHLEGRKGMAKQATNWLSDRLGDLRNRLNVSEQNLQQYKEDAELVGIDEVSTIGRKELEQVTQRYIEAKKQRTHDEILFNQIKELDSGPNLEYLLVIPSISGHELVRSFSREKAHAESKVAELSQRYGPKHPKMIAAQSELADADKQLYKQIAGVVKGVRSSFDASRKSEQALKNQLVEAKQDIQETNRKEIKLRELKWEVESNRKLYNMFLGRSKETDEAKGLQTAHASIVDAAVIPVLPVKPNKKIALLIAVVSSFLFIIGIFILFDLLRNTIGVPEEVKEKLSMPLLGFLPALKGKKNADLSGSFISDPTGTFSESVRSIRTALLVSKHKETDDIILITSSVPSEGKSTVAINIAEAFSQIGKILLIDGDLRRPSIAKEVGLSDDVPGISNLVAGTHSVSQCLHRLDQSNVHIIPAGTIVSNPLEIISSKKMQATLAKLKNHYEKIIIDSPPIHAVSDALILSAHSNAVIYVVRADSTSIPLIKNGINSFKDVGANLSGVILNQVDLRKASRYGNVSSEYFNNYGYNSSRKKDEKLATS